MNLAYLGIALHGFCFAFFFAAAFMFIDRAAPKDARHSAQTVFGIAILGIGPILSGFFNGWLDDVGSSPKVLSDGTLEGIDISYAWLLPVTNWWQGVLGNFGIEFSNSGVNYQAIWWTLAIVAAIASIIVLILFTDDSRKSSRESPEEPHAE
jgi:hypothetical protein